MITEPVCAHSTCIAVLCYCCVKSCKALCEHRLCSVVCGCVFDGLVYRQLCFIRACIDAYAEGIFCVLCCDHMQTYAHGESDTSNTGEVKSHSHTHACTLCLSSSFAIFSRACLSFSLSLSVLVSVYLFSGGFLPCHVVACMCCIRLCAVRLYRLVSLLPPLLCRAWLCAFDWV